MPAFHDVRLKLGGDDDGPWFVIHRGANILALMLRADQNPKVGAEPAEVWVGAADPLPDWGERLADHKGELPLYVSDKDGGYEYRGHFSVQARQHTNQELIEAVRAVGYGLARIVFLQKTSHAASL